MRVMRMRFCRLCLFGALLLVPAQVRAQYYEVPPVDFTGPLSHPRYEQGGFFATLEGLYWKTNRPISSEIVTIRGFGDVDGSLGHANGTFVGTGTEALNVSDLQGSGSWQPGMNLGL